MLVRLKTEEHTEDRGPTSVSPPEKWNSSSTTDSPALYRLPPLLSFSSSGTTSPDTPVASSTTPILEGGVSWWIGNRISLLHKRKDWQDSAVGEMLCGALDRFRPGRDKGDTHNACRRQR